jgi:hypothetical protein
MTITIARAARIRFADETAPLADLVKKARTDAEFAAIVADNFGTVTIDEDFEFTCEWNGHGTDNVFVRTDNRDGAEIRVCEYHADHADVSYIAD